ncbi:MAG: hypothetical protein Q3966_03635 [Neisseria sp.]|nr:hypothetical protein [Neisseria sp.]
MKGCHAKLLGDRGKSSNGTILRRLRTIGKRVILPVCMSKFNMAVCLRPPHKKKPLKKKGGKQREIQNRFNGVHYARIWNFWQFQIVKKKLPTGIFTDKRYICVFSPGRGRVSFEQGRDKSIYKIII